MTCEAVWAAHRQEPETLEASAGSALRSHGVMATAVVKAAQAEVTICA